MILPLFYLTKTSLKEERTKYVYIRGLHYSNIYTAKRRKCCMHLARSEITITEVVYSPRNP